MCKPLPADSSTFGKGVWRERQKASSTHKSLPLESYSLHLKGKTKVTLLKLICKDQKGRVAEDRVTRSSQAVLGFAPDSSHPPPLSPSTQPPVPIPENREQC